MHSNPLTSPIRVAAQPLANLTNIMTPSPQRRKQDVLKSLHSPLLRSVPAPTDSSSSSASPSSATPMITNASFEITITPPAEPQTLTNTIITQTNPSNETQHTCSAQCTSSHIRKTYADNSSYDGHVCTTSNKKQGKGIFINRHGHRYIGHWQNDRRHGHGRYEWCSTGDVYEGSWKNGNMDGHGFFRWATSGEQYLGEWRNGRMCGIGTKTMANKDSFTGMWKNDKSNGMGCKIFACGDRHEGEYRDDRRNGYGRYIWRSGDQYEGNWVNGKMCGQGRKVMANGDRYEGSWLNDKAEGFGVKSWSTGDKHEGGYCADLRHGYGVYYWVSGDRFEGVWTHGDQTGKGTYYYANGSVTKGKWVKGKKHGRFIFTSGNSSWLEQWEDNVRVSRETIKFYPPRLLRTLREGTDSKDAAGEAHAIRVEIERLSSRLTTIQRGEQWQRHVRSSAFNSLVSQSAAALLSPQHVPPPVTVASAEYSNTVPSPAAEIEAAAAKSQSAMDAVAALTPMELSSNGAPASSLDMDQNMESRPISPLTASPPAAAVVEGTIESSAACATAVCRASSPTLTASASASPSPISEDSLCKVCYIKEINTVLLPCAHVAVCLECSTQLERCCICRSPIEDAIQTFKA